MNAKVTENTHRYTDVAREFIDTLRQHSPHAAERVEQIREQYGTRAAYLAAFALVRLKTQQATSHYTPSQRDIHAFTYCEEMGETADAIRLYDEAVAYL